MLNVIKVKLLSERTSGVPPVIFTFALSQCNFLVLFNFLIFSPWTLVYLNVVDHKYVSYISLQKGKWKALQDADVSAMGRQKSNLLPFEEIFSHDGEKSALTLFK